MLKRFLVFYFCLSLQVSSVDSAGYFTFNRVFKTSLRKAKIHEPYVYAVLFDQTIVLIGSISEWKNLDLVLNKAKQFSLQINRSNKPYNLLIYKPGDKNPKIEALVKSSFNKKGIIALNNYLVFAMGDTVWVIGYARTCFEKEQVQEALNTLKLKNKISAFYTFIKYRKTLRRGFIYRHRV